MAELGVGCSPEACDVEIGRFAPLRSATKHPAPPGLRDIGCATGVFVESVRFLHLAAMRHRTYVTPGFIEAGIAVMAVAEDAKIAQEIGHYLARHRVHAFNPVERGREGDRLLALLSEPGAAAPKFWQQVSEGRKRGLRPIVLSLVPRSRIEDLESLVPEVYRAAFEWLKATAVVEFERDNRRGSISTPRSLEPTTRWWWRDDAIAWAIGVDVFAMFDPRPADRGQGTARLRPYPDIAGQRDFASAFDLVRIGAADILAQPDRNPGGTCTPERRYRETCDFLLADRRTYPEGYFRLPWFLVVYHAMLRIQLSTFAGGLTATWEEMDSDFFKQALFSLGIGSRLKDLPVAFADFLDLPWTQDIGAPKGPLQQAWRFVTLVERLSETALDCQRKLRLQIPLRSSFVSYASAERDMARELVRFVEGRNVADDWWDQNSIAMDGTLTETLKAGIASSERFVLVASAAAAANRYVSLELAAAVEMKKPIIVVSPGNQLCRDWGPRLDRLRAEGAVIDSEVFSATDIETCGPTLVAALTREPTEKLAWQADRSLPYCRN